MIFAKRENRPFRTIVFANCVRGLFVGLQIIFLLGADRKVLMAVRVRFAPSPTGKSCAAIFHHNSRLRLTIRL